VAICEEHYEKRLGASSLILNTPAPSLKTGYEMVSVDEKTMSMDARDVFGSNDDSRVTLLGDAAHKTTTQAGVGATAALQDALDLADALGKMPPDANVSTVLRAYEARMWIRARSAVGQSLGSSRMIHRKRGPFKYFMLTSTIGMIGWIAAAVNLVKMAFGK